MLPPEISTLVCSPAAVVVVATDGDFSYLRVRVDGAAGALSIARSCDAHFAPFQTAAVAAAAITAAAIARAHPRRKPSSARKSPSTSGGFIKARVLSCARDGDARRQILIKISSRSSVGDLRACRLLFLLCARVRIHSLMGGVQTSEQLTNKYGENSSTYRLDFNPCFCSRSFCAHLSKTSVNATRARERSSPTHRGCPRASGGRASLKFAVNMRAQNESPRAQLARAIMRRFVRRAPTCSGGERRPLAFRRAR